MSDGKTVLVMVVDQNGWSRDSMHFDRRPVQKCGGCNKVTEIWAQIENHDGSDGLIDAMIVCKDCLANHYLAHWPCLLKDGTVVNGGIDYDSVMRATRHDRRKDK